jgi:hypothetical protein
VTTKRRNRVRLLIAVGVLGLAGAAVALWLLSPQPLSPAEAAVVGTWLSPRQPDGSSTAVVLNPDRTCRVRWVDAAGQDDPGQPPRDGWWRIEGGKVVVDTRRPRVLPVGDRPPWWEWSFEVAGETLVHGPQSVAPVVLRRSQDGRGAEPGR